MKKITLFLFASMAFNYLSNAQCIGTYEYVTVASSNDGNPQIMDGCNYSSDWNNITGLTIGDDYEFSSEIPTDYFTFTDDSNNVIAYGTSPLSVPAVSVTSGRIHVYYDNTCTADSTCRETYIQCTSCTPPPAPDCATAPVTPTDGATNVSVGVDVTFSWTAPVSGATPTSYNVYEVEDALGTNPALITNTTDTFIDLNIGVYDTTVYWMVLPLNGTTEATGCSVWSFTTESFPGYCLSASYGLYPSTAFTPTACDGSTVDDITTYAYASEYSNVNVTSGNTYVFSSSAADLITVSDDAGTAALVYGVSSVSFDATSDGVVRVYRHLDDSNCGAENVSRTISVVCSPTLSIGEVSSENAFTYYPNPVNSTLTLKAQKNIDGVVVYNMVGQEVLRSTPNTVSNELDMSNLATGSYFVEVSVEGISKTVRIIKE